MMFKVDALRVELFAMVAIMKSWRGERCLGTRVRDGAYDISWRLENRHYFDKDIERWHKRCLQHIRKHKLLSNTYNEWLAGEHE